MCGAAREIRPWGRIGASNSGGLTLGKLLCRRGPERAIPCGCHDSAQPYLALQFWFSEAFLRREGVLTIRRCGRLFFVVIRKVSSRIGVHSRMTRTAPREPQLNSRRGWRKPVRRTAPLNSANESPFPDLTEVSSCSVSRLGGATARSADVGLSTDPAVHPAHVGQ